MLCDSVSLILRVCNASTNYATLQPWRGADLLLYSQTSSLIQHSALCSLLFYLAYVVYSPLLISVLATRGALSGAVEGRCAARAAPSVLAAPKMLFAGTKRDLTGNREHLQIGNRIARCRGSIGGVQNNAICNIELP